MKTSWVEAFARAGFGAKAIVYLVLGLLAWNAAAGTGGRLTDPHGAFVVLVRGPFGRLMIALLAVGLAGYAAWRFLEAFADANRRGRSAGGLAARAKYTLSAVVYSVFAIDAARLAAALPSTGGGQQFASLIGRAATSWLGFLGGLLLLGAAFLESREAITGNLSDRLNLHAVSREHGRWILLVGRAGILARAVIFAAAGLLLLGAFGAPTDPANTNSADSLRFLADLPQGRWILALIAAGLMAYGVYQLLHARYRRITPP